MKSNLNITTLKAKLSRLTARFVASTLFAIVIPMMIAIQSNAAPTSQQYALVQGAVDAQIAVASARVAAAKALMHGPFFLRSVGATQLALSMSELGRLTSLKKQTTDSQIAGVNPPQAAIDLAMKQAAARMSIAVSSRNYGLLGVYAAQVAQISSLNQAIQLGNAYAAATPRPRTGVRFTGPVENVYVAPVTVPLTPATSGGVVAPTRRPASTQGECEERGGRTVCFKTSVTIR